MNRRGKDTLLICAAVAVFAVLFLSAAPALVATVWVPDCVSCHEKSSTTQEGMPHQDQACVSCHGGQAISERISYRMTVMYRMVLPQDLFHADARSITNKRCLACHEVEGIRVARGIRIDHKTCIQDQSCIACHGDVGHERSGDWTARYSMGQCLRCHLSQAVYSDDDCTMCHVGRYQPLTSKQNSSFSLVHSENWEQTHGMGDVTTCAACHDESTCARCHGQLVPHDMRFIVARHGTVANQPDNQCGTCHREQSFCDGCHGIEMPHPARFLQDHSAITYEVGSEVCDTCHLPNDCNACHKAHVHPGGASF